MAQNPAIYPIKNLSRCLKHASVLLAVSNEILEPRIWLLFYVMQFSRWPFGGVIAWVEPYSAEQCTCSVQLQVWRKMPQKISEVLPTKQSIHKLADKLKTIPTLIDKEPDR